MPGLLWMRKVCHMPLWLFFIAHPEAGQMKLFDVDVWKDIITLLCTVALALLFVAIPRFQPPCRAFLDNDLFWSKHDLPLQEAVVLSENSSLGKLLDWPLRGWCSTQRVPLWNESLGHVLEWVGLCLYIAHQNRGSSQINRCGTTAMKRRLAFVPTSMLAMHIFYDSICFPWILGRTCAVSWSFRQRCHGCARGLLSGGRSKGVLPLLFQLFRKSSHNSDDLHKIYLDDQWCVYIYIYIMMYTIYIIIIHLSYIFYTYIILSY